MMNRTMSVLLPNQVRTSRKVGQVLVEVSSGTVDHRKENKEPYSSVDSAPGMWWEMDICEEWSYVLLNNPQ
jgi:hypothetical protein